MALYTEKSVNDLSRIFAQEEEARRQAAQRQIEQYNAQKQAIESKNNGGGLGGFLGNIVGGIGKAVEDTAKGVGGLFGTAGASLKDIIEGKANTAENTNAFKRYWYGADNDKDAAAKAAGTSLNAATNLAAIAVPAAGAGTTAAKVVTSAAGNAAAGALGGFADEFELEGANADLNNAANRAIAGGAGGLVAGKLGSKIGNASSKVGSKLLNNKLATSAIGRGALVGAAGGATGGGVSAALSGGDVAQAALQGAGTGAIAGGTQSTLMAGANKLGQKAFNRTKQSTGNVSNVLADNATDDFRAYGDSELATRTRGNRVSDALSRFGDTLEGAQTNVTRAAARDLGIESTGKVIDNVRRKTGITNLDTQAALAKELTGGASSLMDDIQRMALTASEDGKPFRVDTTPVENAISGIVNSLTDDNVIDTKKTIQTLKRTVGNNNSDVLSISNRLKSTAADLRGKGITDPTPKDAAMAKIYTEVAKRLDNLSYEAIPKSNVNDMFDVTISEMQSRANQARANGNSAVARAYDNLATNLSEQPRTIQAYRNFKKDFVDISKISTLTNRAENGAAQNLGQNAGGVVKKIGNTILNRPINSALATAGGLVNRAADAISGVGANATRTTAVPTQPLSQNTQNILSNFIGRTTAQQQANNNIENINQARDYKSLEDMFSTIMADPYVQQIAYGGNQPTAATGLGTSGATTANTFPSSLTPTGITPAQTPTSTGIVGQLNTIAGGMDAALAAGDLVAYAQLAELYDTAYGIYKAQTADSSTQKLSKTQQQANAAALSLSQLEQMNPDFGYVVSDIPVLGNLANLRGNQYDSTVKSLAMQIGYMLSGANIKDNEAEEIGKAYVPQPFDDEATRQYKLQQARNIIQQYQNAYTTDDTLASLLGR